MDPFLIPADLGFQIGWDPALPIAEGGQTHAAALQVGIVLFSILVK